MFEDVLGHDDVKEKLSYDIKTNRLSHAYLFIGKEGIGKKLLAVEYAKKILNTNNLNVCVDYKYIDKLQDKKEILVEQVRNSIVNDVYIAPATGEHKVYIINDAHLLNTAAQNALLKTLEEPPGYVVIILITNNEKALLTTVLSRVKKITFNKLKNEEIILELKKRENLEITEEQLCYADGSLKVALELAKDGEGNKYINIDSLYRYMKEKNKLKAIKALDLVDFKDDETFNYIEHLVLLDKKYDWLEYIEEAKEKIKQNANEEIVKQALSIKIIKHR